VGDRILHTTLCPPLLLTHRSLLGNGTRAARWLRARPQLPRAAGAATARKGVDVALAISLVESALLNEYDAAVAFSGDTDLLPAIEMAFRRTEPRIEIAAWSGAKPLWFPETLAQSPPRYLPYCHFLNDADFRAALDTTDYLGGRSIGS
jgi:hypothetical protein